jgi:hypothetical protein
MGADLARRRSAVSPAPLPQLLSDVPSWPLSASPTREEAVTNPDLPGLPSGGAKPAVHGRDRYHVLGNSRQLEGSADLSGRDFCLYLPGPAGATVSAER